jgi:3-oxoacyl-[acyl-carrier-protein] synthase-3
LAGFTTVADYSRLCLGYPKGDEPGALMFTDARGIHQAAMSNTPILLREVLDTMGISIHDIDHVITHQTSARAIRKGMARMSAVFGDTPTACRRPGAHRTTSTCWSMREFTGTETSASRLWPQ